MSNPQPGPPVYTYGTSPYTPLQPQRAIYFQVAYRRSPVRRFCSALAVAILVWFLITLFIQSFFDIAGDLIHWTRLGGWTDSSPVPTGVALSDCVTPNSWSDEQLSSTAGFDSSAETSFQVPLGDTLFFLSRGPAYGGLHIMSSPESTSHATVHITASYRRRYVRDVGTQICLVTRGTNEYGVGIFTRRWYGWGSGGNELHYEATVVLPESRNPHKPRQITNFETDVPNTKQSVDDLKGHIEFLNVSLKGSNAPVTVESLSAERATIITSNSPIEGTFNSSHTLLLRTSNSHVFVDVGLVNDNTYVSELDIRTSNGKVQAHTSLLSPSKRGGKYLVHASTSNARLHVDFPTSPLDSALRLQATTSNAPAFASLHPAYEGSFSLDTSQFSSSVQQRNVVDPSGKRRERVVETSNRWRGHLNGRVSWGGQEGPGSVTIHTSNSPVTLVV